MHTPLSQRILFITSNRLGDAILSTGILAHLVDARPDARFTIVCGPIPAPLFRAVPRLDRVIPLRKQAMGRHWLSLWPKVAGQVWDLVVDVRDSAVSRLVLCRDRKVLRTGGDRHKVEALAAAMGLTGTAPAPRIWLDSRIEAEARALTGRGPLLALGPAANWTGKEWPLDRFASLADALTGGGGPMEGARILVLGGPDEVERCRPLLERLGDRAVDLVGRTDPLLAGACIARADLYVGNDSGLMHTAAAVGTPTIGLFGPTPADVYGPWGALCRAVRSPLAEGLPQDRMAAIPVATVLDAAEALLSAGQRPVSSSA